MNDSRQKKAMISSTALDLPEYRKMVADACQRQGFRPIMMEHLAAQDRSAADVSAGMVEEADVYLGIFAHAYGSCPDDDERSYTEIEYDKAVSLGIPVIPFFVDEETLWSPRLMDKGEKAKKLESLKQRAEKGRILAKFKSPEDLRGLVMHALGEFEKASPKSNEPPKAPDFPPPNLIPKAPEPYIAQPYSLLHGCLWDGEQTINVPSFPSATPGGTLKQSLTRAVVVEAISRALRLLAEDRFKSDDFEHRRGGWSQTYSTRYIPFAFPDRKPKFFSESDSITVTHWIIRGLASLRVLEKETACLTPQDSSLLMDLLTDVRNYANNHYHDGKGGLFKVLSQQDVRFVPDVRHSATLAKALMALAGGDDLRVSELLKFVVESALDLKTLDHRIPTHAEILAVTDILIQNPWLRDETLTESKLATVRQAHEVALLGLHRTLSVKAKNAGLFFDSVAGGHMAPYYTWWALDCYGFQMSSSNSERLRSVCESAIAGLLSLEHRSGDKSGFPIALDRPPDAGATAQIADVLARLDWDRHSDVIERSLRFVATQLIESPERSLYLPFTIWAFFCLLRTCKKYQILDL